MSRKVERSDHQVSSVSDTPQPVATEPPVPRQLRFRVEGMDCADCVRRVEERLARVEGVCSVNGNALARELTVALDHRIDAEGVRAEIGRLGYLARPKEEASPPEEIRAWRSPQALRTYVSAGLFGSAVVLWVLSLASPLVTIANRPLAAPDLFFLASAIVGGWNFMPAGLRAVRARSLDMNFLMTVAIVGAVAIGQYLEAAAIAFLFSTAELLEAYAVDRARRSIHALIRLSPEKATLVRGGAEMVVAADELQPNDVVIVRGGEKIPGDGVVMEGGAAVDESPITGESMPVEKGTGDEVFAGAISQSGWLRVEIRRAADETTLANIVRIVQEAELRKADTERFIERFARIYTPAVVVAALLVMALPTLALGQPFSTWFVRGLTLLVIACPCAFVISTPVAVVSGITAAARNGVLIKGGRYLEAMGQVEVVAFDKTGTLTYGHPDVTDVVPLGGASRREVLEVAAAVERRSEHPIARAVVRAAARDGIESDRFAISEFEGVVGRGARAALNGVPHVVGSASLFDAAAVPAERLTALRREGKTAVLVGPPAAPMGILALADRPRAGARQAVAALGRAGIRRTVMLTGDGRETAEAIAREVGIDEVHAELLPADKVEVIRRLEEEAGWVAMVGDGINDGPALAVARVGIAMGAAGSDVALQTADVALMSDDLSRLAYLRTLSRTGRSVIRQNVAASLGTKFLLAVGVPFGLVSLVVAVLVGDLGASLAVTGNALRLARIHPSRAEVGGADEPPHGHAPPARQALTAAGA